MFEHGISATWLRRAQWAIYVFFGAFAVVGVWHVFTAAMERDVFRALIAAGVVWGSVGLGIGMHCITQMAAVVDANRRALVELRQRVDAVEGMLGRIGPITAEPTFDGSDEARIEADSDGMPTTAAERLRSAFRDAVFAGEFAEALRVGEDISRRFPGSAMCAQFASLRAALERRALAEATDARVSLM